MMLSERGRVGGGGARMEVQNYLKITTANPKEKEKQHMMYFIICIQSMQC